MIQEIEDYYWKMSARHRLVMVYSGQQIVILCTFFVLPDANPETIQRYYDRPCWSSLPDCEEGPVIYVDKLWCVMPWTRSLFRQVKEVIITAFPASERAIWYRPGHGTLPDRRYTHIRRR